MEADYADNLELFANITVQAECLLHNLEAGSNGLYINLDKRDFMVLTKWCNIYIKCHVSEIRPVYIPQ